ncbi:hypothetical protein JQX13_45740 [Archangium violaceum]|uniref:sensor histidine kinase n=1 Tax=Archangium violaceum TaxID=83451 RepID=UPI00193BAE55|nr:two-component regulator propeller domain-containing protein [Archangium violaceum]QRK07273.1 hypothetical protein JQX13_45740 [Archangium violaceum]
MMDTTSHRRELSWHRWVLSWLCLFLSYGVTATARANDRDRGIGQDREGTLWVGTSGGLDCFRHSSLVLAEFPRGSHDFALAAGNDGAIWAGSTNRPLMRLHDKQVEFTELGEPVRCAYRDPEGTVWLGTSDGIWRIENDRPVRVATIPSQETFQQVQAMTKDAAGALWVAMSTGGLLRWKDGVWTRMDPQLGTTEVARIYSATTDARGRVWLGYHDNRIVMVDNGLVLRYGATEGLDVGLGTALRAGRRLWVGGQLGLVHFDGQRFHPLAVASSEPLRGVAGILEMPDGGLWIHAVPGIFQTWWFRASCLAVVLAGLWGLFLLRLRQMRVRMRGLLEERHRERERIARELHDTLLQGVQGVVLRLQSVAEMLPVGDPVRNAMEDALDRADNVLVESRDRVKDLRAASEHTRGLSHAFAKVGEEFGQDHSAGFHVVVEGQPTPLEPIVRDEVFRIGREALVNAFQHADAQRIEVALTYDCRELRLRVRDDGRGVDVEFLQAGGRPGHWGLSGMRERAKKIGARLDISCRSESGTEVELRVPARAAYLGAQKCAWRNRLGRIVGGGR